ncbi:MAG: Smr/MutS family protein [Deltaproteobacteria bacterium]|jgi:DNA-nicking Smr family endonuclease|nr:Smr/MutS family protein [Deltaproteobacteria bacterium]
MANARKKNRKNKSLSARDFIESPPASPLANHFAGLASLRDSLIEQNRAKEALEAKNKAKANQANRASQATYANLANQSKSKNKAPNAPDNQYKEPTDESLFLRAMDGVQPLNQGKGRNLTQPKPASHWKTPGPEAEDQEVLDFLTDLVTGRAEFDLTYSDEHVEGQVKGLPASTMARLRQGQIPTQDHLDLHGMTLKEAEEAIRRFISRSLDLGRYCLLLIHGRGLRSPDGVSVIKRNLENLLLHRQVKQHILAFTTAKPIDGGLGASYILLRSYRG